MEVYLAQPRGFCPGGVCAIEIAERALEKYGRPVSVRHEILHNQYVVESLKTKGAILVTKVHNQGKRDIAKGRTLILIDHAGHPEVEDTLGQVPGPVLLVQSVEETNALTLPADTPVAYITHTTLSADDTLAIISALQARFTDIQGPDIRDICYATQSRQSAVRDLSKLVDVVLAVGAANSSDSTLLREIGTEAGVASYLIADGSKLNPEWLKDARTVGVTAGASAPEVIVDDVIEAMRRIGPVRVQVLPGREENIEFRLPAQLAAS